jgi:hypothetical protein
MIDFVKTKMRMSHVYQPLVIRYLVESGGVSSVRQLARYMAVSDESQVRFYERKLREMPLRVLQRHGIVTVSGDLVTLSVKRLSPKDAASLEAACTSRLADYLAEKGHADWSGLIDFSEVSASLRYRVLARDRKCRLCGAGPSESPLHVDHILPRSKGGSNDENNLQVLCQRCNVGKGNADSRKF